MRIALCVLSLFLGTLFAEEVKVDAAFKEAAEEIIRTGHFLNSFNYCAATSGNFSKKLDKQLVAMTVSGKHKGELTREDVIVVNMEGKVQNTTKKPSAETMLHMALYNLQDDVGAILHTHSVNATVLSRLLEKETELVTKGYEMHKAFRGITTHESEVHIPIFDNDQDIPALAAKVVEYMKTHPPIFGFLVRGHGLYTWGKDMKEAKIRVETFEFLFENELKMIQLRGLKNDEVRS